MACARASLPSAKCRAAAFPSRASAAADAAAPAAAATTAPAGSAARAAPAAGQIRAGGPSCGAPGAEVRVPLIDPGAARPDTHSRMQVEQQLARRPVGAMDDEAPAQAIRLGADFGAVALDALLVLLAPGFGAADRDRVAVLGIDELDAPGERERLFRRIDDLDHVAL